MINSTENILTKLDEWYTSRFEKKYTQEVADEIVSKFEVESKSQKGLEGMLNNVKDLFSVKEQIEGSKSYFTDSYHVLNSLLIEGNIPKGLPEEFKEQYISSIENQRLSIENLVNDLGFAFENGNSVDDSQIESVFLRNFGNYENFGGYMAALTGSMYAYSVMELEKNEVVLPKEFYAHASLSSQLLAHYSLDISKAVFGDIVDKKNN